MATCKADGEHLICGYVHLPVGQMVDLQMRRFVDLWIRGFVISEFVGLFQHSAKDEPTALHVGGGGDGGLIILRRFLTMFINTGGATIPFEFLKVLSDHDTPAPPSREVPSDRGKIPCTSMG